MQESERSFIYV